MALVFWKLSTDFKPLDVPQGSLFYEGDTHHKFEFDGQKWVDLGDPGEADFTISLVAV